MQRNAERMKVFNITGSGLGKVIIPINQAFEGIQLELEIPEEKISNSSIKNEQNGNSS